MSEPLARGTAGARLLPSPVLHRGRSTPEGVPTPAGRRARARRGACSGNNDTGFEPPHLALPVVATFRMNVSPQPVPKSDLSNGLLAGRRGSAVFKPDLRRDRNLIDDRPPF